MVKKKFSALISAQGIFSKDQKAKDLYSKSCLGNYKDGKIFYSSIEALYLIEKGIMVLKEKNKKINFDKLLEKLKKKNKKIFVNYLVYKDMRSRGYIVKTALKFGAEFRVYDKGVKPGQEHAKWILYPVHESDVLRWHDFSAKNRVAHSTKKNLLIGIVDDEQDITYYEVKWIRP